MISERSLARAVEEGVVTRDQADRLRAIEGGLAAAEPEDDEKLRFIAGFGDIFVSIGLALFLGSLGYFVDAAAGAIALAGAIAAASWVLAEFFTRRRRMALPSIVLLLTFTGAVFAGALLLGSAGFAFPVNDAVDAVLRASADPAEAFVLVGACVVAAAAAAVHYQRFRVPITVAAGVAAAAGAILTLIFAAAPAWTIAHRHMLVLACGLAIFVLAMRADMSDPRRLTRRTDVAFWLHLLAAPLIVHSLIGGLVWSAAIFDTQTALVVLATFVGLGVVAVLVDRRALLVSGLVYAGIACATLIGRSSLGAKTVPTTFLLLGAFVLLLSAGWRPLRAAILALLPAAFARRLPNSASISLS
jgi:hypothetical protein